MKEYICLILVVDHDKQFCNKECKYLKENRCSCGCMDIAKCDVFGSLEKENGKILRNKHCLKNVWKSWNDTIEVDKK